MDLNTANSVGNMVVRPDSPEFMALIGNLGVQAGPLDQSGDWPRQQLEQCGQAGLFRWFVNSEKGGVGCSDAEILEAYLHLSAACLTTTFVLTQTTGALRRIAASGAGIVERVLEDLLSGRTLASLGISHLTTSHRHLSKRTLAAEPQGDGFVLDGFSPWVTGSPYIDWIVVGAEIEDGRQILALLPMDLPGISVDTPSRLMALTGSQTGAVRFDRVEVATDAILAGPKHEVLVGAKGASTGGLQTSALAIGLADAAIGIMEQQSVARGDLKEPADCLRAEQYQIREDLFALATGDQVCSAGELRGRANSLAIRGSQAALAAVKGAGYVEGHPAGRLCREALFFLVWSCPQPVMAANLCELAGLAE